MSELVSLALAAVGAVLVGYWRWVWDPHPWDGDLEACEAVAGRVADPRYQDAVQRWGGLSDPELFDFLHSLTGLLVYRVSAFHCGWADWHPVYLRPYVGLPDWPVGRFVQVVAAHELLHVFRDATGEVSFTDDCTLGFRCLEEVRVWWWTLRVALPPCCSYSAPRWWPSGCRPATGWSSSGRRRCWRPSAWRPGRPGG